MCYTFDPEVTKGRVCFTCKVWKESEFFNKTNHNKGGLASSCKSCFKIYQDNRNAKMGFVDKLKLRYNLDETSYAAMLERSGGRCEICGEEKRLLVDHNHETEAVRGLVCHLCNFIVGILETHPEDLEMAKRYLEIHGAAMARR
jgi:hypothetical protein